MRALAIPAALAGIDLGPVERSQSETVTLERAEGTTFYPQDSTLGATDANDHHLPLTVSQPSKVELELTWTDTVGGTDLDLYATGGADGDGKPVDSGSQGASASPDEKVVFGEVSGTLDLVVAPYLVTDPGGSTYTLTATITPLLDDTDGDGVPDVDDACPQVAGTGANGCPAQVIEVVKVLVDGQQVATQAVDTSNGPDAFDLSVTLTEGTHELTVRWDKRDRLVTSTTRTVTYSAPAGDDGGGPPVCQPKQDRGGKDKAAGTAEAKDKGDNKDKGKGKGKPPRCE